MNIREIEDEIVMLENGDTTYSAIKNLAALYIVRDGLTAQPEDDRRYSYAAYSGATTEFGTALEAVPRDHALKVLEEHMEAVKALYPKEYQAVLDKLRNY